MIGVKSRIYFYHTAAWHECKDVLQDPAPAWEFGLPGNGPMDLVADTGMLTFSLDNAVANEAGLAGYYSPGHTNCPAWFKDGLPIWVVCTRQDDWTEYARFVGCLVDARPAAGVYDEGTVEVTAQDWMQYISIQKQGQLAIESNKTADEALTTALTHFEIQPDDTDFEVGKETWPSIFNTDDSVKQKMAALFQKLCRNELGGYIFLQGDGTLTFHNRHHRPANTTVDFTLDATGDDPMAELEISWERKKIQNRVEVKITPTEVDVAATTVVWKLQDTFYLSAGQTLTLTCGFRDPNTSVRISASEVVDPLVSATHIKFGSIDDGVTNDLIGNLTFPMTVGGNSVEIVLTNTGSVGGYVNFLEIIGKGHYTYDPLTLEAEDTDSITDRGERTLEVKLEQIANPLTARLYAVSLKQQLADPFMQVERVRFLANLNDEFMTAAMTAEVNTRFAIVEEQTGVNAEFFVCRLKYEQVGPLLWVEIVPAPAGVVVYAIYDLAPGDIYGYDSGAQYAL